MTMHRTRVPGRLDYYEPTVHKAVVAAVRVAFQRSRTSTAGWKHRLDEGRLDMRNVWRVEATHRADVFRDRLAPGATKVNVHILVDGSGSMTSEDMVNEDGSPARRIEKAADITATLADAFRSQPSVRLNVWLHNTVVKTGNIAMWPVITNSQGRGNVGHMTQAVGGGNGDGYAIKWVAEKVKKSHRKGEVDLIIVVSDGLPSWLAVGQTWDYATQQYKNDGVALVHNVVEEARERGIKVMSIAIAPNNNQVEMYGEQGVIPFTGDWAALATSIGSTLGATLAEAARDPKVRRR